MNDPFSGENSEPKFRIEIKVDMNDADYNTDVNTISESELKSLMPLIEAIKNFKPYTVKTEGLDWTHHHNYPCGENLPREDLGEKFPEDIYLDIGPETHEFFRELCPFGGFHSIVSIIIYPDVEGTVLFKAK